MPPELPVHLGSLTAHIFDGFLLICLCLSWISQDTVQKTRWDQIHNQRFPLLQLGPGHQRGGCRGHRAPEHQGCEHPVAAHEPQLGAELAIQR